MQTRSCNYLEGGLSFAHSAVKVCAIRHHGRGAPELQNLDEVPQFDLGTLLERREAIRRQNQAEGHPACRDCPHLEVKDWGKPAHPIRWLGITHYIACNLSCNYCWLTWAKWSPRNSTHDKPIVRYEITPIIREMDEAGLFSPDTIIDWGGGGEPTLMPEFDWGFELFQRKGFTQWLHTNAVRMPASVAQSTEPLRNTHLLTSVDAGTSETYKRIKSSTAFERVWNNLAGYGQRGASINLKYIVTEENCGEAELENFMKRAVELKPASIVLDIDYRKPRPSDEVLNGLAELYQRSQDAGIHCTYGSVGGNSALEYGVREFVESKTALPKAPARKPLFIRYEKGDIAGTADEPTTLVLTTHRAASTLLHKLLEEIRNASGMALHSQNGPSRNLGHFTPIDSANVLQGRYGIIGPLRIPVHDRILKRCEIVLHLRDPRDVLVSLYYAVAYSHADMDEAERASALSMGLDEFVLQRAPVYRKRYETYARMAEAYPVHRLRYEDLIVDPSSWLDRFLAAFPLQGDELKRTVNRKLGSLLAGEIAVPASEDIHSHVRQVAKGDHQRKLQPATIASLDESFAPACDTLGIPLKE